MDRLPDNQPFEDALLAEKGSNKEAELFAELFEEIPAAPPKPREHHHHHFVGDEEDESEE